MKHIVVVGGGAGGLELVTKLGKKLGRSKQAKITLVDQSPTHLWKPLLHELAVGTMDAGNDAVSYRAHARENGYTFNIGRVINIDRENKTVALAPLMDKENSEVLPQINLQYDLLIMAIGSTSNDFGTSGVKERAIFLDSPEQALYFQDKLLTHFIRLQRLPDTPSNLRVAIIGAGATGVELSAELYHAVNQVHQYGFDRLTQSSLSVTLIEAGDRILGGLPERISEAASKELLKLGVDIKTQTFVSEINAEGIQTKSGDTIKADLVVWAAGIKVHDFMKNIGGLETNHLNQLTVLATLQTTEDDNIFAIGDCANLVLENGKSVPPRAQSAHQMASCCYKNILAVLNEKPLKSFQYKDHGSLVSLANYSTVGNLMGNVFRGSLFVEGKMARLMYISLYRLHQMSIHGWIKTGFLMLINHMNRWLKPKIKLH